MSVHLSFARVNRANQSNQGSPNTRRRVASFAKKLPADRVMNYF